MAARDRRAARPDGSGASSAVVDAGGAVAAGGCCARHRVLWSTREGGRSPRQRPSCVAFRMRSRPRRIPPRSSRRSTVCSKRLEAARAEQEGVPDARRLTRADVDAMIDSLGDVDSILGRVEPEELQNPYEASRLAGYVRQTPRRRTTRRHDHLTMADRLPAPQLDQFPGHAVLFVAWPGFSGLRG